MNKVMIVVRKEYLERVKSKAFLIGTLIGPVFMGAMILGPALLADVAGDQDRTVAVIDRSGEVLEQLRATLVELGEEHVTLEVLDCGNDDDACLDELKDLVLGEGVDAGLVIPADYFDRPELVFYNTAASAIVLREDSLEPALNRVLRAERFRREGLDPAIQVQLMARSQWQSRKLSGEADSEQSGEVGIIGGIMMVMIIYFMVLVYGQQNLTVVIEEKSSRMVEVLLASLRPEELMMGKVLGIGLAALTQVAVWTLAGMIAAGQGVAIGGSQIDLSMFGVWFWFNFVVFFLLGYFVYASLYAGIGAMCNSVQDAQQFSGTLTMGVVLPIMLMMLIIKTPDQPLATVLSLIPFFSPILMFMRSIAKAPPNGRGRSDTRDGSRDRPAYPRKAFTKEPQVGVVP